MDAQFPHRLAERLGNDLPGRGAQSRFEPELSYGRHYAPPPANARTAAVLALLYPWQDDWHLPLMVRTQTLTDHAGQISFPGGMIDAGEESGEAAVRELEEELGVERSQVQLLGKLSPLYLFVSNFSVTPWVGVVSQRPELIPNPHEVDTLLEPSVGHLLDEANYGWHARSFNGLNFRVPHIAYRDNFIWGATGMILGELIELLRELRFAELQTNP